METNFQMLIGFKDYKPQDSFFTSEKEVKQITKHFHLNERDGLGLQNLRDMVVLFYDNLMEREIKDGKRSEKFYDYNEAMMSVTAVIDNCKCRMGMEI